MPDDNDIVFNSYGPDLLGLFSNLFSWLGDGSVWVQIQAFLGQLWTIYSFLAFLISALLIFGIIYASIRTNQFLDLQTERINEAEKLWRLTHNGKSSGNAPWHDVQTHIKSNNPNDWKLAIIEADIILGKTLESLGYAGNTIGDKLKSASVTQFRSLQDAWDAHLIRNRIAHEGGDFVLTQRMAQEAIIKYERVFLEFKVI